MRNVLAIGRRELRTYFDSPLAYVVFGSFYLIVGWMFYNLLAHFSNLCLQYQQVTQYATKINLNRYVVETLLGNMSVILLLILPVVTMGLIAEERARGTLEMLLTRPVSALEIILGKYLAACLLLALLLLFSAIYLWVLGAWGDPDWGPVITGYLGLFLMGAAFLSLGLAASSVTDNQIVAAIGAFAASLSFWIVGWAASSGAIGELSRFLEYLSLIHHYQNLAKGVVSTSDLLYFLSMIFFGLYLAHWVLNSQRWR